MPHAPALADELDAVASALARMPLASRRDPGKPYEDKQEIVARLFGIADRIRKGERPAAARRERRRVPSAKGIHGVYVDGGRYVPVVKR